jgi:hypothetical protein
MVTNIEHVAVPPVTAVSDAAPGILSRAMNHLQSAVCGLHGHDPLLVFEDGRMFLRCTSCGHQTPGWETGERKPRLRFAGDASRHQLHASPAPRSRTIS